MVMYANACSPSVCAYGHASVSVEREQLAACKTLAIFILLTSHGSTKHERKVRDRPPAVKAAALVHGLRPSRQRRHSSPSRVGTDYISNMLRVLVDVRRDVETASGSQAPREKVERVRPDNSTMLVLTGATLRGHVFVGTTLCPGIRKKHADLVETRFWSYV